MKSLKKVNSKNLTDEQKAILTATECTIYNASSDFVVHYKGQTQRYSTIDKAFDAIKTTFNLK